MRNEQLIALAARAWHALVLGLVGLVALSAARDTGGLARSVVVLALIMVVLGYLLVVLPRLSVLAPLADRLPVWASMTVLTTGAAVMILDSPTAVLLLVGVIPLAFYTATPAAAITVSILLTASGAVSFALRGGNDAGASIGVLGVVGVVSIGVGLWLSQVFALSEARRETIDQLEQSRFLAERLARVEGASRERAQFSADLHDGMAQHLSALSVLLAGVDRALETEPAEAASRLRVARRQLDEALTECRFLVGQQSVLDQENVVESVRATLDLFEGVSGAETSLVVTGDVGEVHQSVRFAVHKIVTEALSNCLHHAHASAVRVELTATGQDGREHLRVDVIDDGCGFDPQGARPRRADGHGYGLDGMRRRAAHHGGCVSVDSVLDRGTRVCVELPLDRAS